MSAATLMAWDETNKKWINVICDSDGKLKISWTY